MSSSDPDGGSMVKMTIQAASQDEDEGAVAGPAEPASPSAGATSERASPGGAFRRIRRWALGDYGIYLIYRYDQAGGTDVALERLARVGGTFVTIDRADLEASGDDRLRRQAWYLDKGGLGYGIRLQGRLVAVCFAWPGGQSRQGESWHVDEGDAYIAQLHCLKDARGQGLGSALKGLVTQELRKNGFRSIYSQVWFSNKRARQMNVKNGWRCIALTIEVFPIVGPAALKIIWRRER